MKTKERFKNILKNIEEGYKRFPVTILVSTILVIMLIFLSERQDSISQELSLIYQRVVAIIALGIPLSLCIKLFFDKKGDYKKSQELLAYVIGAIALILYYIFLLKDFEMVSVYRYVGVSIFLYLGFAYIPWIKSKDNYEFYIIKVFSSFFLTIIYSSILYLGIVAILFTINQLFNANIPGEYFYYVFLIIQGIFAPSVFLARIPEVDEKFENYVYPRSLKILLLYIITPLLTIYSAILYVYFLKIIVTRDWPQGLVSHLVLWYSTLSIGIIFFLTPITKENRWANTFRVWFPRAVLPILLMMFISIGIRINAYGVTENRYLGVVLGLWITGIMIYFIFKKKGNNIIIPISLSIIALSSVIGPISSFTVSKLSQNNRLKTVLTENNMLEDGQVVKVEGDISKEDRLDISSILNYFNSNHSLDEAKYLPEVFEIASMEKVLGFSYIEEDHYNEDYFYYTYDKYGKFIDIEAYDYFLEFYNMVDETKLDNNILVTGDGFKLKFKIRDDEKLIYEKDIKELAENIIKIKRSSNEGDNPYNELNSDEVVFLDENEKVKIKFVFNGIYGEKVGSSEEFKVSEADYYVLIKIK